MVYAHPSFIKHVPVRDRARYILNKLGSAVKFMATDYTAFESHFTPELLEACEFQLYRYMLRDIPQGPAVAEAMCSVFAGLNLCKFKTVQAVIRACRMSGEMTTSLGNGFTNYMVFLFIHDLLGNEIRDCVIEGDDCLGAYSGVDPTTEDYAALGFNVKIELHNKIEEASFCGLIFDREEMVSITDPMKVIMNIGWASARYINSSDKVRRELLRAKGLSYLHQYAGCPVVQNLAVAIIRLTQGSRFRIDTGHTNVFWGRDFNPNPIAQEIGFNTRMLMERVFRITVSQQHYLEEYFDGLSEIAPLWHHVISYHTRRDWSEYYNRFVTHNHASNKYTLALVPGITHLERELNIKLIQSLNNAITTETKTQERKTTETETTAAQSPDSGPAGKNQLRRRPKGGPRAGIYYW